MTAIAAAYVAAHLPFLSPSLEDIDSINFALALHDYDPAQHQPHPPGYPLYIVLGRLSLAVITFVTGSLDRLAADALALTLWSAVGGAIAVVAAWHVFDAIARVPKVPGVAKVQAVQFWATALLAVTPLFWLSGLRPMSDMPGLAAALVAQALLLKGSNRFLVYGALVAGLAAGIRVQSVWLTMPVLALALWEHRGAGIWWLLSRPAAALAAGGLVWAILLLVASGGIDGYLAALGSQAGEDFAWVDMLWANPTPRRLAFSLYETLILPWAPVPLAAAVLAAVVIGAVAMLLRERRAFVVLAIAFAPYAAFHLLFQETLTVRYALPVLPPITWLAARGIATLGRRSVFVAAPLTAASLFVAFPGGHAYGSETHPAFRAIADMVKRAETERPAAVYANFGLWRALQAAPLGSLHAVEPRRQYAWLGPVDYWRQGGTTPVWFLADPKHWNLALIDPQSRGDVTHYRWGVSQRPELGGARPLGADWYRFDRPGWFAGEGWSLTPEAGGLTELTATGPDHRPIEAWIRRRSEPLHMLIGGRHFGSAGDPAAEFELTLDDAVLDRWTLSVDQRNFLQFVDLPAGTPGGGDPYARLTVASRPAGGDPRRAHVAIRQFDVQSADRLIYGFGEGWHEHEATPAGVRWRWTSKRSVLRLKGPAQAIRLTLRGESPLKYVEAPPTVKITAGDRVVGEFRPDSDFEWSVTIPADAIAASGGAVTIETDRIYLPGQAEGTADERQLGLRLYETRLDPVSP